MVTKRDIVYVHLTTAEVLKAKEIGKSTEFGGISHRSRFEREKNLASDNFYGTGIGELALNKHYLTVEDYILFSKMKKKSGKGDGGSDMLGYQIDCKNTPVKNNMTEDRMLNTFHLNVNEKEFHENTAYVLILTLTYGLSMEELIEGPTHPLPILIGWMPSNLLRNYWKHDRYSVPASDLLPISTLNIEDYKKVNECVA